MTGFLSRISNSPTEANYGGSSRWEGTSFTATAGTNTTHDYTIASTRKLFSGTFHVGPTGAYGDTISFAVVDVLGIVAPPGTVLSEYVTDMGVVANERRTLQSGQVADLEAGMVLRTTYFSTGASDVDLLLDWQFFIPG